jgi:hypothetical protein
VPPAGRRRTSHNAATFLTDVGEGSVIRFDVDADRVMKLEHIHLP